MKVPWWDRFESLIKSDRQSPRMKLPTPDTWSNEVLYELADIIAGMNI